jgi:hypothetical protein
MLTPGAKGCAAASRIEAAILACVAALMVLPPSLHAQNAKAPATLRATPLTSQQRTLHALNCLTFGPRPGDEAAVKRMGIEAWFQQQLHPETMDDHALNQKLLQFPAMRLTQGELTERFPPPQTFKMILKPGDPGPHDPTTRIV